MPGLEDASRGDLLTLIAHLQAHTAALEARVAQQDERIAVLEKALSRNSGNSSMPPSTDGLPGRSRPAARRSVKGGARGKRKGAPGSGLAWIADPRQLSEVRSHYPAGACDCGADLTDAAGAGIARSHQVHDVPLVTETITQHDLHRLRCDCGRVHVAARPDGVQASPVSYGPNLRALVVYLLVLQHVPVHRCAQLITDLTGAKPSPGFIHGMLRRTAAGLGGVSGRIRSLISTAPVAGFDETVVRAGPAGQNRYVLSASTPTATLFGLGGRDLGSFRDFAVLPGFTGVAVHDRYVNYDNPELAKTVSGHQLCVAHLLRDLTAAGESHPSHHWPAQAIRALRFLVHAANTARGAGLTAVPQEASQEAVLELRRAVTFGLAQIPRIPGPAGSTKQIDGRLLLECLRDRQDDVLRFLTDTRIPPTNNLSERDLRPTKTQQKISGRLQSEDVTRDRLTLRSYISTAAKHGIDVLAALRDAVTGNPWMPPLHATT